MQPPRFPPLPATPPPRRRPTTNPLEARRGAANRLDSITGKVHSIEGFFDIEGAGEAILEIKFPVWFIEKPTFGFGGEMAPGQVLVTGAYPMLSVLVHHWLMHDYPGGVSYFAGAVLIIVTTGPDDQRLVGHWRARGRALRNPGGETLTVDAPI